MGSFEPVGLEFSIRPTSLLLCFTLSPSYCFWKDMTILVDRHISPYFSLSLSAWQVPSRDEFNSLFVAFNKSTRTVKLSQLCATTLHLLHLFQCLRTQNDKYNWYVGHSTTKTKSHLIIDH